MPCGVIDFGDVTRTLRVCELAVAASIAFGHEPDDPICAAAEIVRGFDAACPLDDAELEALPHLIAARAAIVAVGTEQQARARAAQRLRPARARGGLGDLRGRGGGAARARGGGVQARLRAATRRASRRACPPAPGRSRASSPGAAAELSPTALDPADCRTGAIGAYGEARCHATRELSQRRAGDGAPRPRRVRARGTRGARAAGRPRRARRRARARARGRRARPCAWPGSRPAVAAGEARGRGCRRRARARGRSARPRTCTCRSRRRA